MLFFLVNYVEARAIEEPTLTTATGAGTKCPFGYERCAGCTTIRGASCVRNGLEETIATGIIACAHAAGRQCQKTASQSRDSVLCGVRTLCRAQGILTNEGARQCDVSAVIAKTGE